MSRECLISIWHYWSLLFWKGNANEAATPPLKVVFSPWSCWNSVDLLFGLVACLEQTGETLSIQNICLFFTGYSLTKQHVTWRSVGDAGCDQSARYRLTSHRASLDRPWNRKWDSNLEPEAVCVLHVRLFVVKWTLTLNPKLVRGLNVGLLTDCVSFLLACRYERCLSVACRSTSSHGNFTSSSDLSK